MGIVSVIRRSLNLAEPCRLLIGGSVVVPLVSSPLPPEVVPEQAGVVPQCGVAEWSGEETDHEKSVDLLVGSMTLRMLAALASVLSPGSHRVIVMVEPARVLGTWAA